MCLTIVHNCLVKTNTSQSYKTRKITDAVLRNMKASLVNRNWNIFENTSVHESSESLFNEIKSVMDFYAAEKTIALNAKST